MLKPKIANLKQRMHTLRDNISDFYSWHKAEIIAGGIGAAGFVVLMALTFTTPKNRVEQIIVENAPEHATILANMKNSRSIDMRVGDSALFGDLKVTVEAMGNDNAAMVRFAAAGKNDVVVPVREGGLFNSDGSFIVAVPGSSTFEWSFQFSNFENGSMLVNAGGMLVNAGSMLVNANW